MQRRGARSREPDRLATGEARATSGAAAHARGVPNRLATGVRHAVTSGARRGVPDHWLGEPVRRRAAGGVRKDLKLGGPTT